jgi:hypothetical protein
MLGLGLDEALSTFDYYRTRERKRFRRGWLRRKLAVVSMFFEVKGGHDGTGNQEAIERRVCGAALLGPVCSDAEGDGSHLRQLSRSRTHWLAEPVADDADDRYTGCRRSRN